MNRNSMKTKRNPTKIEDMTKEQIRRAILKKRECNAKAQLIVENLIENPVTEAYFLESLPDINQSHFDDIIEERSILHLCGYPICSKPITEKDIPKQKYKISVRTNKVYDITARKSFCSNACFKAAMHIKKQMLTSPLWFREYDEIPKFHLVPLDTVGSLGQEIDLSLIEKLTIKNDNNQAFTSVHDFTNASLEVLNINDRGLNIDRSTISESDSYKVENHIVNNNNDRSTIQSSAKQENYSEKMNISCTTEQNAQYSNKSVQPTEDTKPTLTNSDTQNSELPPEVRKAPNPLNIIGEIIEKPDKKIDPILLNQPNESEKSDTKKEVVTKVRHKKEPSITTITIEVEQCLTEWFTLDSMLLLFGEEKVKGMITDKDCLREYISNYTKSVFYTSNVYDQYQQLCRRLNLLELEDKKIDPKTLHRETRPLPDYSILKEESNKMQLKVRAFLGGVTEIPEVTQNTEGNNETEESNIAQIPLVDKNAQNALRRKIVCQHLNKVLPDLLRSLGLHTLAISSDVRLLVNTFHLKANNIMFKPMQWMLIAIVLIKMLSLKNPQLEHLLHQPMAYKHLQLLLLSYEQDGGYLDRLVTWLTDINRIVNMNNT